MVEKKPDIWKSAFDGVMVYVLWMVIILLALWVLIVARGAVNIIYIVLTWNRWVLRAVDRWSLLLFGIVWLIAIIAIEDYLRQGVEKGQLYQRFTKVAGAAVLLGALLALLQVAIL